MIGAANLKDLLPTFEVLMDGINKPLFSTQSPGRLLLVKSNTLHNLQVDCY